MRTPFRIGRGWGPVLRGLVLLAAAGLATPAAQAEFKVGTEIPALSLKGTDGLSIEVKRDDGKLTLQLGNECKKPKALIILLFQSDCLKCRAQLQALQTLSVRYDKQGVIALGIVHRGKIEDARKLVKDLSLSFPVATGMDSKIAQQFASGDPLGIVDASSKVRFAQSGYDEGDAKQWERSLDELVAEQVAMAGDSVRERGDLGVGACTSPLWARETIVPCPAPMH